VVTILAGKYEIGKLLEGNWHNVLDVERFANHGNIAAISVASHSWLISMLAMFIFDSIPKELFVDDIHYRDFQIELFRRCLIHDIEEGVTGDIPLHDVIKEEVKQFKHTIREKIIPDMIGDEYLKTYLNAKAGIIGIIVAYADMLSVIIESLRERNRGNKTYNVVMDRGYSYLYKISHEDINSLTLAQLQVYIGSSNYDGQYTKEELMKLLYFIREKLENLTMNVQKWIRHKRETS
jgi:5'-deoxynucleotidase YfbR-like HD superfamily hydrolase